MRITDVLLKQVYAHGMATYPSECFGFLVGSYEQGGIVRKVVRGSNLRTDRPDRFEMDPAEFVQVERDADEAGLEVIGFYHSHPDWPAIPSQTDVVYAWEGAYYLIVSVHDARPLNVTAWMVGRDCPRRFLQEPLEIMG